MCFSGSFQPAARRGHPPIPLEGSVSFCVILAIRSTWCITPLCKGLHMLWGMLTGRTTHRYGDPPGGFAVPVGILGILSYPSLLLVIQLYISLWETSGYDTNYYFYFSTAISFVTDKTVHLCQFSLQKKTCAVMGILLFRVPCLTLF